MNWTTINQLVDTLKHKQERDSEQLLQEVNAHIRVVEKMYGKGWPEAEVFIGEAEPSGIPVELAKIVKLILQFCAEHDIDLGDALNSEPMPMNAA